MNAQVTTPAVPLCIAGTGGQASTGMTLPAISAAWRGRLNAFADVDHLRAYWSAKPYTYASLSTLPTEMLPFERMVRMGRGAMDEALSPVRAILGTRLPALPVLLAVPPPRPGWDPEQGRRLAQELISGLPIPAARELCSLLTTGHGGGLTVLAEAADMIARGAAPWCLVGGVDSARDLGFLRWMEDLKRLKMEDRPNGLIPGEGAGFLLLAEERFCMEYGLPRLARVLRASRAEEPHPWYTFKPCLAQGLTAVFHSLLTEEMPIADETWSDLNGESWRADEWSLAYIRTGRRHGEPLALRHPADSWGDVGAASGPLLAGLCVSEFLRGRSKARTALLWTASDTGPFRSACLIQRMTEGGRT